MKSKLKLAIYEACEDGIISAEDAQTYLNFVECADLGDPDDVDVLTEMVDAISYDGEAMYETKDTLVEAIGEAYEEGKISAEDANTYLEFVECADLEDPDDVDVLTEMVDAISYGDYYLEKSEVHPQSKSYKKTKRSSKLKAKNAANKGKIAANKGKLLKGAAIAGGVAAAVGAGYAAGKSTSDKKHDKFIKYLNNELTNKTAEYADAKEKLRSKNDALLKRISELESDRRALAFKAGRAGVADSIKNRAHVDLDDYKNPPSTPTYARPSSLAPNSLAPSSSRPVKLTAADIAARRKPIQPSSSRPGRKPGRR